jgi:hypothetical protein
MKLLIAVASIKDIDSFVIHYSATLTPNPSLSYLFSTKILHHDIDVLEIGVGVYQATYKTTKALSANKYHLALKISFGNAYKESVSVGSVLNIINEKPGDFGMLTAGVWKDHYDFNLLKRTDPPHVNGGFINLNNAYLNIFSAFKKVVSVTVNNYGDKNTYQTRVEKYKADCETGDGLGFVYPCLFEQQGFYQLCVIERNLATSEENYEMAKQQMNETLISLVEKL